MDFAPCSFRSLAESPPGVARNDARQNETDLRTSKKLETWRAGQFDWRHNAATVTVVAAVGCGVLVTQGATSDFSSTRNSRSGRFGNPNRGLP